MKSIYILTLCIAGTFGISAQQLPLYTQHQQYFTVINPAAPPADYFSELDPTTSFGLSGRSQWGGVVPDAPTTLLMRGDFRIPVSGNTFQLLAGGHLMKDATGPTSLTSLYLRVGAFVEQDLAGGSVAFSLGGGRLLFDPTNIIFIQTNGRLDAEKQSKTYFDLGVGAFGYIKSDEQIFFGGLSIPQLFVPDLTFDSKTNVSLKLTKVPHYYLLLGSFLPLSAKNSLELSSWGQYVPNAPIHIDVNARFNVDLGNDNNGLIAGAGVSPTNGSGHLEAGVSFKDFNSYSFKIIVSADKRFFGSAFGSVVDAYEASIVWSFGSIKK